MTTKDDWTVITGHGIGESAKEAVPVSPHGDLIDRDKFRNTVFIGELRVCPLLVQSNTEKTWTIPDTSYTRTFFLECLGHECAAYKDGVCVQFGGKATYQPASAEEGTNGE